MLPLGAGVWLTRRLEAISEISRHKLQRTICQDGLGIPFDYLNMVRGEQIQRFLCLL